MDGTRPLDTDNPALAAAAQARASRAGTRPDTFDFDHKVFTSIEGTYFRISDQTNEPVFMVNLGGNEVALTLAGIRKEFQIEAGSKDDRLLVMAAEALNYVSVVRPGDAVPPEMITGAASWAPTERDIRIAHHRLTVQLVSWLTGEEHLYTDPEQLLQLADDPAIKKQISEAFTEAAERIGLGRDHREEVVRYLETLSQELAYIETLRRVFQQVQEIEKKVQGLRRIYGSQRSVADICDPVARLARLAVDQFKAKFDDVDAQTSEIIAMLKNIDSQVAFIRTARDQLHRRLMVWDEMIRKWSRVKVREDYEIPSLLRDTYHFLAPRFMQVNEWVLVSQALPVDMKAFSHMDADRAKAARMGKTKTMVWD